MTGPQTPDDTPGSVPPTASVTAQSASVAPSKRAKPAQGAADQSLGQSRADDTDSDESQAGITAGTHPTGAHPDSATPDVISDVPPAAPGTTSLHTPDAKDESPADTGEQHNPDQPPDHQTKPQPDPADTDHSATALATPEPQARSGVGAMILGGAFVAALGAGAALIAFPQGWRAADRQADLLARISRLEATLATQSDRISSAETAITATAAQQGPDLASLTEPLSARIEALEGARQDTARIEALDAEIAQLRADLDALPAAQGLRADQAEDALGQLATATETAAAQAAALDAERAAWAAERTALAAERQAMADRLAAEADRTEAAAKAARIATAMLDLEAALDSGGAFQSALDRLAADGITAGAGLRDGAAMGVPTQAIVQDTFPEAARAALRASLSGDPDTGLTDRVLTFLRLQTGARALGPRAGDDPDAVLSRAEAALNRGDLGGAISTLDTLPPNAAAQMADWRAKAARRMAALDDFAALPAPLAR